MLQLGWMYGFVIIGGPSPIVLIDKSYLCLGAVKDYYCSKMVKYYKKRISTIFTNKRIKKGLKVKGLYNQLNIYKQSSPTQLTSAQIQNSNTKPERCESVLYKHIRVHINNHFQVYP